VQSREETGVRWGVEGDLGIIASQATVTAPLTDRAALFLSGRRSYTGWLIGALSPKGEDDLNYRLQDYDATLAWQIDDHNKLIVNSHYGDDETRIVECVLHVRRGRKFAAQRGRRDGGIPL